MNNQQNQDNGLSVIELKNLKQAFINSIEGKGWLRQDGPPPPQVEKEKFIFDLRGIALVRGFAMYNEPLHGYFIRNGELREWITDLTGASMYNAGLNGVILRGAVLREVDLRHAVLMGQNTDLVGACLEGAKLYGCNMDQASLEGVKWGRRYKLGDELEADKTKDKELYKQAESVYRNLKRWHNWHGMYSLAGEFHYREWECRKKQSNTISKIGFTIFRLSCGYLERPGNVLISALLIILTFSIFFGFVGNFDDIASSLYFSLASFTALGYGEWISKVAATPLARWGGVTETIFGVGLISLFLVTVTRKFAR